MGAHPGKLVPKPAPHGHQEEWQWRGGIAERYELAKEQEGRKLVPLLTAIGELIPWLKQWHNEPDMAFGGTGMGNYFEEYLAQEAKAIGQSVEQVMAWTPPPSLTEKTWPHCRQVAWY